MKDTFSKVEVKKVYPRAWDDHRVFWTVYSDPADSRAEAFLDRNTNRTSHAISK